MLHGPWRRQVIRISQDPLGRQGRLLTWEVQKQVWVRQLASGDVAVALYNRIAGPGLPGGRHGEPVTITLDLQTVRCGCLPITATMQCCSS